MIAYPKRMQDGQIHAYDKDTGLEITTIKPIMLKNAFDLNVPLISKADPVTHVGTWKLVKDGSETIPVEPISQKVANMKSNPVVDESSLATKFGDIVVPENNVVVPTDHEGLVNFIHSSYSLKPEGLIMKENKWKYLIRQACRGRNIMMVGEAGFGKTLASVIVPKVLNRPFEVFNLGGTQDPQSYLIGNTHFRDNGTVFDESLFIRMIQTENAVIVLDEFSRAHPDAGNILMPVIDVNQRRLLIDAKPGTPYVNVARGVTFIATANIGDAYTSTRQIDKALFERFVVFEMDIPDYADELKLLMYMYPGVPKAKLQAIAKIAHGSRVEVKSSAPHIDSMISPRQSIEMAGMVYDGFSLSEAAVEVIYSFYATDGGNDSPRTFMKSLVQSCIPIDQQTNGAVSSAAPLFGPTDMGQAANN